MGGINFGWLTGFRAQNGSFANWNYATLVRCLSEAAAPGVGECRPCPYFETNNLIFALQHMKITEKPVRVTQRR